MLQVLLLLHSFALFHGTALRINLALLVQVWVSNSLLSQTVFICSTFPKVLNAFVWRAPTGGWRGGNKVTWTITRTLTATECRSLILFWNPTAKLPISAYSFLFEGNQGCFLPAETPFFKIHPSSDNLYDNWGLRAPGSAPWLLLDFLWDLTILQWQSAGSQCQKGRTSENEFPTPCI